MSGPSASQTWAMSKTVEKFSWREVSALTRGVEPTLSPRELCAGPNSARVARKARREVSCAATELR